MRLRSIIGDAGLWIPPRLWSYAAENQPDGDFSKYSAPELAMLLGYSGDAQGMLEALQQASFMDGMQIHDWREHNAYHQTFSDRAKKAAAARWKGQEMKKKGDEKKGKDKTRASIGEALLQAFDEFWKAYPSKVGRGEAEKSWKKMGCEKMLPQILVAIRDAKLSQKWGEGYIPNPATWINQKRWKDELLPRRNGTGIRENIIPNILRDEDP